MIIKSRAFVRSSDRHPALDERLPDGLRIDIQFFAHCHK
jgi:hypothetical protein